MSLERPNKFPRQARTTGRATRRRRYPAATNPSSPPPPPPPGTVTVSRPASSPRQQSEQQQIFSLRPLVPRSPGLAPDGSLSRLARPRFISKALPLLGSIRLPLLFPSNLQTRGRRYYSVLYRPHAHAQRPILRYLSVLPLFIPQAQPLCSRLYLHLKLVSITSRLVL